MPLFLLLFCQKRRTSSPKQHHVWQILHNTGKTVARKLQKIYNRHKHRAIVAQRRTAMQEILMTQNLCKRYGNTLAVDNVSISVPQGSICGLVGKNGAGKTTLMRMLCGLVAPNQGSICLVPNQARTSTTVGAVVESPSLYQEFCAMDNLVCQCKLLGIPADKTYLECDRHGRGRWTWAPRRRRRSGRPVKS